MSMGRTAALLFALIHRSAWKGNSKKFVSRSGHLAYMICFVWALRSDRQAGHPLELPLLKVRGPAFLLLASAVLAPLGRGYAELLHNGVLRSSSSESSPLRQMHHRTSQTARLPP
jgi:hypothetical protein